MTYKVVQWATGAMGKCCLRSVIDHPDLDLVGLFVHSEDKVGKDAGEIAKRHLTGIQATRNLDEILALEADVVIHAARLRPPYAYYNPVICRLLASGKNVISINGHTFPFFWGNAYTRPIIDACQKGSSTLFGTGLNPGFIAERIAPAATALCQRIERINITEIVSCVNMRNPTYVFDILGFGAPCGSIDPNNAAWPPAEILNGMYSEVVALLVRRLGLSLETVETDHLMLPASQDIRMAAGLIKKGTNSHCNWRWHGIANNQRVVTLSISWIMETAHLDNPDYHLWQVDISGLPEVKLTVDLNNPKNYPYRTEPEQLAVAASVINSIPAVCAADPGIMEIPVANHYQARFDNKYPR